MEEQRHDPSSVLSDAVCPVLQVRDLVAVVQSSAEGVVAERVDVSAGVGSQGDGIRGGGGAIFEHKIAVQFGEAGATGGATGGAASRRASLTRDRSAAGRRAGR